MYKSLLIFVLAAAALPSQAITWKYGSFHATYKTCKLIGWGGTQPSSGKLTIPSQYTDTDGKTYTVNAIASDALNNLTEVTEITIPATIKTIGNAEGGNGDVVMYDTKKSVNNFLNCPKLTAFKVASGNQKFAATGAGILVSKDIQALYRVPQAVELSTGDLNISDKVKAVIAKSLLGNTTAETITFPAQISNISPESGFHEMKRLSKIVVPKANTHFKVNGGALVRDDNYLMAYPPARTIQNEEITSPVTQIADYAFANTKHLKTLVLPVSVHIIGDYAFKNSSVTKVNLPDKIDYMGYEVFAKSHLTSVSLPKGWDGNSAGSHMFAYCKDLTSMTFNAKNMTIPEGFARGCSALKTVKFTNGLPEMINDAAFKDCTSLTSIPLSLSIWYAGDSIFANTGLTKAVFDNLTREDAEPGDNMFSECKELTTIDFSAITPDKNCSGITIGPGFVSNAPKLKTIKFPEAVFFANYNEQTHIPNIGYGVPIEKMVISTFTRIADIITVYQGTGTYSPKTYVKTTNQQKSWGSYNNCALKYLYSGSDGAKVTPVFYCEAYKPLPGYETPDATYYVPGLCAANYEKASKCGAKVSEIYSISATKLSGSNNISVTVNPTKSGVTINTVAFNDENATAPDADGVVRPKIKYRDVKTIRVKYTVNGEKMETLYPIEAFDNSSIGDIISGNTNGQTLSFTLTGRDMMLTGSSMTPTYSIYNASGSQVMSGNGTSIDLTSLLPGMYIIKAGDGDNQAIEKFMLL